MTRVLNVYLHEALVGQLRQDDSGRLAFQYNNEYLATQGETISLSLPKQIEPFDELRTRAFFSGLLPDELVRYRLAKFLGVSEKNPFSLLEIIGGECAGALGLYPEDQIPPSRHDSDWEALDDTQLGTLLELLKRRPLLAGRDNLRLSLAGAQNKIAVGIRNSQICLVSGSSPTTHIIKPVIENIKDSVHNELFCMKLAEHVGIDVPDANIRWVNDTPYFLIERYDRHVDIHNQLQRIHQEDFCQALAIMPEQKYQREGGPSVSQSLELLQQHSSVPALDILSLIQRLIFNYLIGNADAHGKNFSLLYHEGGLRFAPAYDLFSTAVYPELSAKMAMKIGSQYYPESVLLRHWHTIVPDTKGAQQNLEETLKKLSHNCVEQAQALIDNFQSDGICSAVFEQITQVIEKRSTHIQKYFS